MKIRSDFVTNSSSSSYICIAEVQMSEEFRNYMKEEFGRFGERLLKEYVTTGSEAKSGCGKFGYLDEEELQELLKDDKYYIAAEFIEWTSDGDTEGDDAFLYNNIPYKYMTEIFRSGDC